MRPFPALSKIIPLVFFGEGGWYQRATRGERRSRRLVGLMLWPFLHTEYWTLSGPQGKEAEELLRAYLILLQVRGLADGSRDKRHLAGWGSFGWKAWCWRALIMETGSEQPRRVRHLGVFLGVRN